MSVGRPRPAVTLFFGNRDPAMRKTKRSPSPEPLLAAVAAAGWRGVSLERLRDVEWARRLAAPWPLGWLETLPHYAIVADR